MFIFCVAFSLFVVIIPLSICQCPVGQFQNPGLFVCESCTVCGAGEELKESCSGTQDAKCQECAEHYFSRDGNNCSRCSTCEISHVVISVCNRTHDTVCQLVTPSGPELNATEPPTIYLMTKKITEWSNVPINLKRNITLPIVLGVISAILITVLCILGCYMYLRKTIIARRQRKRCDSLSVETSELEDISQNTPRQSRYCEFLNQLKNEDFFMADVTADLHEDLGRLLNPDSAKGWRYLSGKLGFKIENTNAFGIESHKATQEMLSAWSASRSAKLSTLACLLFSMGRDDAVLVIHQWWCENRTTNV